MLKLKKKWYKILKDSGFKDIENEQGLLHSWDSLRFQHIDQGHFISVREKYLQALQLPHLFELTSPIEKTIWTLYADGYSYREISAEVIRVHKIKYNKDYVQRVVWKLNSILHHQLSKLDPTEEPT